MANYTMTIYQLKKNNIPLSLSEYPIFNESYRAILNKKIEDEYMMRELGFSTIDEFNHHLQTRMNKIMPIYNKRYLSQEVEFKKKILELQRTEETDNTKNETRSGNLNTDSTSNSKSFFSDTPNKTKATYELGTLGLTNVSDDETIMGSDSTSSDNATILDDGTTIINEFKDNTIDELIRYNEYNYFNNIDSEIILELKDLFHMLYSY